MNEYFQLLDSDEIQVLQVRRNLLNELANKEILRAAQSRMEEGFSNFVLDLSKVEWINSVGLNLLIGLKVRSEEAGGRLAIAHASDKVKQLLEITKLSSFFFLTDTVDEAMQSFSVYE